jgi:hypothetical protein
MLETTAAAGRKQAGDMASRATPRLWLLQGKTAGDNAQVLALGESLAEGTDWRIEIKPIPSALRQFAKRHRPHRPSLEDFAAAGFAPPWPEVIIACGRTPCIVAQWIRGLSQGGTVHVQLGRLGVPPEMIDLVLETAQYGVPPTPNMISLTLPIVRRDAARQAAALQVWRAKLAELPRPWLAVLVGGPASPIRFEAEDGSRLLRRIMELKRELGGSALIAYGPRTPNPVREILETGLKGSEGSYRIFGWPPADPNPYPAVLALADRFLVTCDSASMMADACVTGRPVEIFMLPIPDYLRRFSSRGLGFSLDARRRRRNRAGLPPDLIDRLRDFLVTKRLLTPYRDIRDLLQILERAGVVGKLGEATAGTGRDLQAREIAAVKARIVALMRRCTHART